jgi:hypothetical protein
MAAPTEDATMSLYDLTVPQLEKSLQQLEIWIDKANEFAKTKKFEPNDLLAARLAPDQFPLARQIMSVCDGAKFICARASGKEAPVHPDTEKTWDELRTRIRAVREFVRGFKAADFEGAAERIVPLPWMPGKALTGKDYVLSLALPNFYFHLVTTYALLRHNGVDLGKMDYLGPLPLRDV